MTFITPKTWHKKRLRSVLAYKYIDCLYEIEEPSNELKLFFPVDAHYLKFLNFKAGVTFSGAEPEGDVDVISITNNPDTMDRLTFDTVLFYEDIENGKIFDNDLTAYSVNIKYERPNELKEYFHRSNLEGLFIYIKAEEPIIKFEVYSIYEDLDSMK